MSVDQEDPEIEADHGLPAGLEATEEEQKEADAFVYNYLKQKLESEASCLRVVWVNEIEETGFQYDLRIEEPKRSPLVPKLEGGKFVIFRVSNAGKEDVELCSITNPFRQWKEMNLGLCLAL
eukprot:g4289.t1